MMMNRVVLSCTQIGLFPRRLIQTNLRTKASASFGLNIPKRSFAEVAVVGQQAKSEVESQESIWARMGVDVKFDQQKHAYVLAFPWNFPEIVNTFES